jgi:hypothetical protein
MNKNCKWLILYTTNIIMSGASDKARFYLEQAVPQLQEFKEKKIFTEVKPMPCTLLEEQTNRPRMKSELS